jgi:DNA-binding NarL/FixJ family response regulator
MKADFLERKSRVFVVDDHPLVRDGLSALINQQEDLAVCGCAEDYVSAVQGIATTRPHVALVDVSLRNTSGLELIKDLKLQQPTVATIVVSMHDEMLYAERALRAGARGYVMKRESSKNVLLAIRRVLEGGVYLSESVVARMASQVAGERARDSASAERVEQLSDRELEIFRLLGRGLATAEIADVLHLSMKTVQAYCARAKEKLGLTTAVELRRTATRWEDAHAAEIA